jgi:uncharacterized protein (DUF488 family)
VLASVYSLGHSSLPIDCFLSLLSDASVSAVADVRSSPFSRRSPWFSQRELKGHLKKANIAYAFLGEELGGRPSDPGMFTAGIADYDAMSASDLFHKGIDRLIRGSEKHRIAMVCSEKDPLHCHRCLMVGRALLDHDVQTSHLLHTGQVESQAEAEVRLLKEENLYTNDWLMSDAERLTKAYRRRSQKVAYSTTNRDAEASWSTVP